MTISNDAKTAPPSPKSQPNLQNDPIKAKNPAQKTNTQHKLFPVMALSIAFIAMGCAFYAVSINIKLREVTAQQGKDLLNQMNTLKQLQNDTVTQLASTSKELNESQDKLQNKFNTIDKNLQSALQQRLYQSNDWLLLKARYYLELAQINAHWSDNLQTTAALLQQADAILANVHDQQLFNIRQVIAKETAELQAIPRLDITGLLSQLDAALDTIATLPLKLAVTLTDKKNIPKEESDKTSSTWQRSLKNSVSLLESLVVIRRHNEDIVPLPSPAYESMLREGIRLNLQEAQWAILQNNDPVYQFSLTQAIQNIKHSFAPDDPGTTALLKQLITLQKTHLILRKPILEQSLPLLNKLIESKDTETSDKQPTDAGVNP